MNPKSKDLTFIFGTFEMDSLKRHEKAAQCAEHQVDVIAFDFAPNTAPKTRNLKASIKVDHRFLKAETSISKTLFQSLMVLFTNSPRWFYSQLIRSWQRNLHSVEEAFGWSLRACRGNGEGQHH